MKENQTCKIRIKNIVLLKLIFLIISRSIQRLEKIRCLIIIAKHKTLSKFRIARYFCFWEFKRNGSSKNIELNQW